MKRRKSRNLLFMCVILLMAALAAGCGSKEDDGKGDVIVEETTAESDSAKETTAAGTTAAKTDSEKETTAAKADSKKKTTAKSDSAEETTAAKSKSGKKSILSSDSKKDTSSKKAAAETAEAKEEPIINSEDFYGCWEYATEDIWFYIYGDGTYEVFYSDGTSFAGEYYMDGADLCADFDLNYTFDEDGTLVDSDGDELFPSTLPDFTPTAYVKANDIDINYTLGQGDVSLADGACYYEMGSEGRYYGTAPLTCSVYQDSSEDLGNGRIEKKITLYQGFRQDQIPMFDSGVTVGHEMMFYDYYTGVLLPDNDYFGGGSENSYYFEFETTGGWVDLYIDVTVGHKNDVGDYRFLSEFTITVNMPSWYDGLFVSVPPQPATYAELMERNDRFNNLDSFIPALELPWDVRNALNCGIW